MSDSFTDSEFNSGISTLQQMINPYPVGTENDKCLPPVNDDIHVV